MTLEQIREKVATLARQRREIINRATERDGLLTSEERESLAEMESDTASYQETIRALTSQRALEDYLDAVPGTPPPPAGGTEDRGAGSEFRTFGDFVLAVRRGDRRALEMGVGASGGVLVPDQFKAELMKVSPEASIVRPRATVIPAGDPPDAKLTMPALDQGTNGVFAGATVTWIGEGGSKAETDIDFRDVTLEPFEVAAHIIVTDKLLRNAPAASSIISEILRGAIRASEDYQFLRGDGASKPLGVMNSGCKVNVTRNTASSVVFADVASMLASLNPSGWSTAVWIANVTTLPKLIQLADAVGNSIFIAGDASKGIPPTLFGMPILLNGRMPTLGNEGDLVLADLTQYLIKDGSGPYVEASEHVYFTNNKTVIKAFWNVDGRAWWNEALTLEDGSTSVSPFVVLK